jgi:phenylpyruvate tautomerase PptA (4-oxalocrotonate tautomerase family)
VPIYTCTTNESTLSAQSKKALAGEIAELHSEINHVPSTYVNVVFYELPADSVYTDGVPASPVLVSGWIREGHPKAETTRLATEIAAAVTRVTGVPAKRVLVVFETSPASFDVNGVVSQLHSLLAELDLQRVKDDVCACAGEGRGDEATHYGPVDLDVTVTILETAHQQFPHVAYPQVDVRPGQPSWQFIVRDSSVEVWIPKFGSEHLRRPRSDQSSAQGRAIGGDQVPGQGVAAGVVGDVEKTLDDLIRKAALPGDCLVCPVDQCARVPCDQLDEQIVAVSEVAVDAGTRQSDLGRNVVDGGLADSVAIDAAFSGGQDPLACIACARRCRWLTARSLRHEHDIT